MKTKTLGNIAAGLSVAILCGWGVFWALQVKSAWELIQLANAPL